MPHIIDWDQFASLLAKYAKSSAVRPLDVLLSGGLDMPSIAFVESHHGNLSTHGP